MKIELPDTLKKKVNRKDERSWSDSQKNYILNNHGKKVGLVKNFNPHSDYSEKTWEFEKARPEYGEICDACKFPYCFYAEPRNWSMGSDSDVWNLMKCANANCGKYFESCL